MTSGSICPQPFRHIRAINNREFAESATSIGSYNPGSRFLEALTADPDPVGISP